MMRLVVSAALVVLSSYHAELVQADDTLNSVVTEAFEFAGDQLTALKENTLTSNDKFIDYTDEQGMWSTISSSGKNITKTVWTSGMVAGMYWHLYEATGDNKWKEAAEDIQIGLDGVELLDDNDIGFQVQNSFGLGYRLVGKDSFKDKTLAGAQSLYKFRYQENIPAFWSWFEPGQALRWKRAVNVDMIMNMEIMLWAAENGGDQTYLDAVAKHADMTWDDLVRDDHSTYHVADYDETNGTLKEKGTYQGWNAESTWSRGQAWAVYGFAMVYRYLSEERFLDRSKLLLGYFDENLPDDNVPYADFDAPINDENPKDSSATAIVASALFELFEQTGDPYYLEKGQEYMSSLLLNETYFNPDATDDWEALLRRSSKAWDQAETGSVTGDYFLLETMVRYKTMAPSILLREEMKFNTTEQTQGSGDGTGFVEKVFKDELDDNDFKISGLDDDSPVMIWFGVTLSNVDLYPDNILIKGDNEEGESTTVTVNIPALSDTEHTGGWIGGPNTVSFSVEAGTFSAIDKVRQIALVLSRSAGAVVTDVTVDYLIVGHKLKTSRPTASSTEDDTVVAAESESEGESVSGSTSSGSSNGCTVSDRTIISGVESDSGKTCCSVGCQTCGGDGCDSDNGCCTNGVKDTCSETVGAPCLLK